MPAGNPSINQKDLSSQLAEILLFVPLICFALIGGLLLQGCCHLQNKDMKIKMYNRILCIN